MAEGLAESVSATHEWLASKLLATAAMDIQKREAASADCVGLMHALGCFRVDDERSLRSALLPVVLLDPTQPWTHLFRSSGVGRSLESKLALAPLARLVCQAEYEALRRAWTDNG